MEKVNLFSPQNILSPSKGKEFLDVLKYFECNNIDDVLIQIEKLRVVKWVSITDTTKFWVEVYSYRDAGNNNPFPEIARFAIKLISLPWSNTEIERIFSQMNLVKSKLRNSMGIKTLNAILNIRLVSINIFNKNTLYKLRKILQIWITKA